MTIEIKIEKVTELQKMLGDISIPQEQRYKYSVNHPLSALIEFKDGGATSRANKAQGLEKLRTLITEAQKKRL